MTADDLAVDTLATTELQAVKQARATGEKGALAKAYCEQAAQMRNRFGIGADLVDRYCVRRLNDIARGRISADAEFLATAKARIFTMLKGFQ